MYIINPCPLYPRKRTFAATFGMSAKCQRQTSRRFRSAIHLAAELSPDCAFVGGWRV